MKLACEIPTMKLTVAAREAARRVALESGYDKGSELVITREGLVIKDGFEIGQIDLCALRRESDWSKTYGLPFERAA